MKSVHTAHRNYNGECEVLIVDDSSENESNEIQKACKEYDCTYIYFENAVSAKRNYGGKQAKNDVILFLDSDCIATEHILENYAEKWLLLLLIPLFIIGENIIVSLIINNRSSEKKATLSQQLMAQFLIHDSESAYMMRCLKTGNIKGIGKQMIYYLGQYNGMLHIGLYVT